MEHAAGTTPVQSAPAPYPGWSDLYLQLVLMLLGFGFLLLILRRSLQDQDLLRAARRRTREQEREALLELFEDNCPEADGEPAQAAAGGEADVPPEPVQCAICMLALATSENEAVFDEDGDLVCVGPRSVVRFACPGAHRFHRDCIREWVARGKSTCPVCKFDLRDLTGPAAPNSGLEDGPG